MRGCLHHYVRIPVWLLACVFPFYVQTAVAIDVKASMSSEVETVLPMGHAGAAIAAIVISPDGHTAVVGDGAGNTKLWDLRTATEQFRYVSSLGGVLPGGIAYMNGGRALAVVGSSGLMQIMDARTGSSLRDVSLLDSPQAPKPLFAAFSGDARRLVLLMEDEQTLQVVDTTVAKPVPRTLAGARKLNAMAISGDGRVVAAVGADDIAYIWDAADGRLMQSFKTVPKVSRVALSPDGAALLVGAFVFPDIGVVIGVAEYEVQSGKILKVFDTGPGYVQELGYAPEGARVVAGVDRVGKYETVVWNRADGRRIAAWDHAPLAPAFGPGGLMLSGTYDGRVAIRSTLAKNNSMGDRALRTSVKWPVALIDGGGSNALTVAYTGKELVTWSLTDGRPLQRANTKAELWSIEIEGDGQEEGGWDLPVIRHGRDGVTRMIYSGNALSKAPTGFSEVWKPYLPRRYPIWMNVSALTGKDGMAAWRPEEKLLMPKWQDDDAARQLNAGAVRGAEGKSNSDIDFPVGLRFDIDRQSEVVLVGANYVLPEFLGGRNGHHSVGRLLVSNDNGRSHKTWRKLTPDIGAILELRLLRSGKDALVLALPAINRKRVTTSGLVVLRVDLSNGSVLWKRQIPQGFDVAGLQLALSPDERKMALALGDAIGLYPLLLNLDTGAYLESESAKKELGASGAVAFSPDGQRVAWAVANAQILLVGASPKNQVASLRMHQARTWAIRFSRDGKRLYSASKDGTVRVWDVAGQRELVRIVRFESGDWITVTPEGYFAGSPGGIDKLSFRRGDENYALNRFYDVFYRPDLVQRKLAGEDLSPYITVTAAQALAAPPPLVTIEAVPQQTGAQYLRVRYTIQGNAGIGAIRVYHNGKLVDSRGDDALARRSGVGPRLANVTPQRVDGQVRALATGTGSGESTGNTVSTMGGEIEIEPLPGENVIAVTAFNGTNTVQSRLETVAFRSTRVAELPRLHILAVGINRYRDPDATLDFAVKDAREFSSLLKARAESLFGPGRVEIPLVLNDAEATRNRINTAFQEIGRRMRPEDVFVAFFSGHGVLENGVYALVTHDYAGTLAPENTLSAFELGNLIKRLPAKRQLWVLDTCHAGGLNDLFRGLYDARVTGFARRAGLHVFASSQTLEEARDGYRGNGLYTHVLLQGMKLGTPDLNGDGRVTATELGNYSREEAVKITRRIGHRQSPTIAGFGEDLPVYATGKP